MKSPVFSGFMKPYLEAANFTLAGVIHECPYSGKFQMINATYDRDREALNVANKYQDWPNGVFKQEIRIHDNKDDNIGTITYFWEYYTRENHLKHFEDF